MSKRENEQNNAARPSDRSLTEHDEEQKAQRKNLEGRAAGARGGGEVEGQVELEVG